MIRLEMIGHLGKDAVINVVGERKVINFNVAHSSKWKDRQGNAMQKTYWVSCSYWTDSTAVAQYLRKGQQVFVEGEPDVDFYNFGGQTGIAGIQKLNVRKVELLGSAKSDSSGQPSQQRQQPSPQQPGGDRYSAYSDNLPSNANDLTTPIDGLPF